MNVQIVRSAPSLTPSLAAMSEISGGAERCFLDNLEVLCNAVGGIEAVRHLVLALATRGRLVPQLAHETPTRMGTAVPLEDVPWSPPKGWAWLRWVDVSERIGDIDHKMPIEAAAGYPYVSPRDFLPNNQINYDAAKKISREAFLRLSEKIRPEKGDLIFSRYGTLGETRLVETDREFLASYSCAIVKCRREFCSPKYVYYYAQSPLVQSEIARYVNTTTQGNVGVKSIKMFMFPLPPLAEQERIVAKVDELMRMLDDLEAKQTKKRETQTRLRWAALGALTSAPGPEEFNAAWKRVADNFEVLFNGVQSVADLRVTILDVATKRRIIGPLLGDESPTRYLPRLVGRSADELGIVSDDALPSGWAKIQIGTLFEVGTGSTPTKTNSEYWVNGTVPWTASAATNNDEVCNPTDLVTPKAVADFRLKLYPKGSLIVALYGQGKTRGQVARLQIETAVNQACAVIRAIPGGETLMEYVWLCFRQKYVELRLLAAGGAQPNLNLGVINSTRVAVPPTKEMQRIVEAVERLMKLCDDLEAKFRRSEMTASKLVEAVVAEMVA